MMTHVTADRISKVLRVGRSASVGPIVFGLALTLTSVPPCFADEDPTTVIVPYSSSANRTIGDAVNIAFPYSPLGRCISYEGKDIHWDTAGSISSDGKVSIVSEEERERRTTNLSLGFQTNSKVKAGVFSANSAFDTDFTKENFRGDESRSITLSFSAYSDYGRRMIESYKIDGTAPSPKNDIVSFRQQCGTHFIRGERHASDLTIFIRLTSSSEEGKDAILAHLKHTIGGGVSLKAVTGDAGTTFTSSYNSIVEFAKKSGVVTVDYHAHGGPGIAAAGAAAKIVDPADFAKFSDIVTAVSALFTQDNSGLTGYVLQSDTALGAPEVHIDLDRVEQIGSLTRVLLSLNEASKRYDDLNTRFPSVFKQYFQPYGDKINLERSQLVQLINTCAAGGDCTPPTSDILRKARFLEDMFSEGAISLSCQYQRASDLLPTVTTPVNNPKVLESISINLNATSGDSDLVDFSSVHVNRLTPNDRIEDATKGFSGFSMSAVDAKGNRRVFGTIYSENIVPRTAIAYDNSTATYSVDVSELQRRRDLILGSTFSVTAPGPSGVSVTYDTGFPPRTGCSPLQSP